MKKALIIAVLILGVAYVGQAQKAVRVEQARLKQQFIERRITKAQFDEESAKITFGSVLMDPKLVLSVD